MTERSLEGIHHIHLAGIGGIGVSALAPMLLHLGYSVSGSDPASNEVTDRLKTSGIRIVHEHKAENLLGADLLVYSTAVKADNPEIVYAKEHNIPIWHRAQMLGYLMQRQRGIVIAGAHGKTSTTAMITKLLLDAQLDPSAFIGGDLPLIGGNSRIGNGEWVIAEGDESDGSFVHLRPEIAIVNNIDADHLDYYQDIQEIQEHFHLFLRSVPEHGWILYSADSPYCENLTLGLPPQIMTYGFSDHADIRALHYTHGPSGSGCDVMIRGRVMGKLSLALSGRAYCHNALAAIAVGEILGIPFPTVSESLASFTGVHRRMEHKGSVRGIAVLDDYAHHPTEIRATVQALRDRYDTRLIGIFQPHLYSRTLKFLEEFGSSFAGLDHLILTDIYPAREKPMPGVTGEVLLEPVRRSGVSVEYIANKNDIPAHLAKSTKAGDVVVTLGAGNVHQIGEEFLRLHSENSENEKGEQT